MGKQSEKLTNFNFSIQKGFSVNKNLHFLNIANICKYKSNIKMSLDGSNAVIIVLNCEVLCLKPRKKVFVIRRLCRLNSSVSFSPFSFISLFPYFPMIFLSNESLLRIFVFALKLSPIMIKTFLLMLLMSDNCSFFLDLKQ